MILISQQMPSIYMKRRPEAVKSQPTDPLLY